MENQSRYNSYLEPFLASIVVIAAGYLGAKLLIFLLPWRSFEIYLALLAAIVLGIGLSILSARRTIYRVCWRLILVAAVLVVGSSYALLYFHHRNVNLPTLAEHFSARHAGSPETGKGTENAQAAGLRERLWDQFRRRPSIPAAGLQALYAQPRAAYDDPFNDGSLTEAADALAASRYEFLTYPPVQLPEDLDWTENPYDDRSWNWHLHNMRFVSVLSEAYRQSGELRYLQRAENLILDWIEDNSFHFLGPVSEFSWNDHSTAFRLMNWLYFWEVWSKSPLFDEDKMERILRSMLAHGERLASADFYTDGHNHGIDQDRALIALSLVIPEIEQSGSWRSLALERLESQIRFAVSPRGVHLEHSPGYHLYGLNQLQEVLALISAWQVDDGLKETLPRLIGSMAGFVELIVQPNGRIVPVGDTAAKQISDFARLLAPLVGQDPRLECLLSDRNSCERQDQFAVYSDEGYAVIRDFDEGRLPFDKSFYLFFTAAAHEGRGHKQSDDLSFVLSYGGYDLLIDPGVYSYKRDAGRSYVVSAPAHNTVIVDGKGFRGWDTRLDGYVASERIAAVNASHRNYGQVAHSRWLIYLRPSLVILVDSLEPKEGVRPSDPVHRFTQLFHSSKEIGLSILESGKEIRFSAPKAHGGFPLMRIVQMAQMSTTPEIASGGQDPMLGWNSPQHGVLEPAPVAMFHAEGESTTFVTAIELSPQRQEGLREPFARSDFSADIRGDDVAVTWIEDGTRHRVTLNRKAGSVEVSP